MRRLHHSLLAFSILSTLGLAVACGSSPGNGSSAGGDAGGEDGSMTSDTGAGGDDSGGQQDSSLHDGGADATDSGTGGDTGTAGDGECPPVTGTFSEATHGPLPTVAYYGGPVMTAPLVVTFTFQDTPNAAALQSFGATIASTSWFTQVTSDYCVPDGGACIGAGPAGVSVPIAANADATYVDNGGVTTDAGTGGGTDLNAFVNQQVAAAVAAHQIPAPNVDTVYMFYFPSTTTITGFVGQSCNSYGAYHSNQLYTDGTTPIVYAIMPDCAAGSARELQSVTVAASHELAEAASDPTPGGIPGWYLDLSSYPDGGTTTAEYRNDPWLSQMYGEIGDNCESVSPRSFSLTDGGTVVQRIWSKSAAAAGHDPCIPVPANQVYFNASTDKSIYVASVGDTFTVDVSPFADDARASWQLDAVDQTPTQITDDAGAPLAYLKLEWAGGVVRSDGVPSLTCQNNGMHPQLQVTLLADPAADSSLGPQGGQEWAEAVGVVYSVDESQTTATVPGGRTVAQPWPFAVITPATAATIGVPSSGISDMMRHRHHRSVMAPLSPRR